MVNLTMFGGLIAIMNKILSLLKTQKNHKIQMETGKLQLNVLLHILMI